MALYFLLVGCIIVLQITFYHYHDHSSIIDTHSTEQAEKDRTRHMMCLHLSLTQVKEFHFFLHKLYSWLPHKTDFQIPWLIPDLSLTNLQFSLQQLMKTFSNVLREIICLRLDYLYSVKQDITSVSVSVTTGPYWVQNFNFWLDANASFDWMLHAPPTHTM